MPDLPKQSDIDFPQPKALTAAQKAAAVNDLFNTWQSVGAPFRPYIVFNALDQSILNIVTGQAQEAKGNPILYCPFPGSLIGMSFVYLENLLRNSDSAPVFVPDPRYAVFLQTEGFIAQLTYGAAQILSNSMMAGLTTRLVLEKYGEKWAASGLGTIQFKLTVNNLYGLFKAITLLSDDLRTPIKWKASSWLGRQTDGSFVSLQAQMMDACSLQGGGIILGWLAGDSILGLSTAADRQKCLSALWRLIGSKYTTRDLGAVVAYSLNYLIGFIKNERTVDVVKGQKPNRILDPKDLYFKLDAHLFAELPKPRTPLTALTENFYNMLVDEFYAIAEKGAKGTLTLPEATEGLKQYRAFLIGFQRGSMIAAETLFAETFRSAYSLGYSHGFRDGYAQGYAAGWQAGYDAGFSDGKDVGSSLTSTFNSLADMAKNLQPFLKDAVQVGTVIVEIAALL